jgi:hypothetical protein
MKEMLVDLVARPEMSVYLMSMIILELTLERSVKGCCTMNQDQLPGKPQPRTASLQIEHHRNGDD